jgi:predicted metal-binding protein
MLRKIFGSKSEVTGGCEKLHNVKLREYFLLGGTCGRMGEMKNAFRLLKENQGKEVLGRATCMLER